MFQNCFRILKLQVPLINGLQCTWCVKKSYSLEYNKIKECENLIFSDDLKFWSFSKMKHWICKGVFN